MMMRLVQVSSTESISSISASSAQNGGNLYLRRGSVCGSCRVLKPNRVAYNSMILSAMRTCGFHTVLPKLSASVSSRKRFSSTASPLISQTTSPFAHPRSSVIVSSLLSPSDIHIPQKEWFALRKEKLTTSTFSTALGFWKGTRRAELWHEKVYPKLSASVSSRKRFSSTASPLISQTTSPFAYPRSSVIVSSLLSPSDIPQKSEEWFALRKDKLTTSTFSTALGFWKGTRRAELWHEKVYDSDSRVVEESARFAMNWGVQMESAAIERYKRIMGCEVGTMGFAIHSNEQLHWLGASPDGILDCFGILEVKCPYNKGKTETVLPWKKVPYYYMPQLQGQMEIMDREWVNLYCWTRNGSTVFRVMRDRSYWKIIHDVLREFWWENVLPAREALLLGKEEEEVKKYEPTSTHKRTGLAISKSITLAGESKLVCREIADHVEFF